MVFSGESARLNVAPGTRLGNWLWNELCVGPGPSEAMSVISQAGKVNEKVYYRSEGVNS